MKLLLAFLAYSLCICASLVYFDNYVWIGQSCESSSGSLICNKKQSGTDRVFFLTLNACINALSGRYSQFLCASGIDTGLPDATVYSSYREVFYSGNAKLEKRAVALTFRTLPFAILVICLSAIAILLFRFLIRRYMTNL